MRGAHGLGELEADIMAVLWDNSQLITVRHVLTALQRPAAYTTVMTVMDNLHRKGLLTRERRGRAYHYRPVWSREEYTARLMREVLGAASDHDAVFAHFVSQMTAEEARSLQAVWQRHKTRPA
jgi:predicted transcriptional regulator